MTTKSVACCSDPSTRPKPHGAETDLADARSVVDVEVLTVTDCPHRDLTMDRVLEALDRVESPKARVTERVIDDPADALVAGMHGSPTILIDGHDPFAADTIEASVSCRLYPTPTGFDGAPSVDDLIVALSGRARLDERWHGLGDRLDGYS